MKHSVVTSIAVLVLVMLVSLGRKPYRKLLLGLPIGMFLHLVFDGAFTSAEMFWWLIGGWDFSADELPVVARGWWNLPLEIVGAAALWLWCDAASGRQAYAKSVANRKETFSDVSTYERILVAAKAEVAEFGILGLRLDRVARRAHVSMPLIYRHFEDRDELIAVVLGDHYEEWVTSYRSWVDNWLAGATTITLEEFAQLSPKPNQDNARKARTFRLQVLSTSLENPALRERLEGITTEAFTWTQSTVERARPLLPEEDRHFDARIFTHLLFNTMFVFSDLVTGGGVDDSEFTSMVVSLLRASSRDRARERL